MTREEKSDWRKWWCFCYRRIREFLFLGVWMAMTWALDVYIVRHFSVSGPPKYMLIVFEILFDLSTLLELILLLFWPYKMYQPRRSIKSRPSK